MWHLIQHWLAQMTGSQNTPGTPRNYNFWSGFGSDLGEVALIGAVLGAYRKHKWATAWQLIKDIALTGTGLVIIIVQIWAKTPSDVLLVVGLALTVPSATSHAVSLLSGPGVPESSESSEPPGEQEALPPS
jgi:hypothetical protein